MPTNTPPADRRTTRDAVPDDDHGKEHASFPTGPVPTGDGSTDPGPTRNTVGRNRVGREAADPRRWAALAVLVTGQLMIVLDASVVNIALPQAQADLGISDAARQWAVTAYAIAFGSLLLLGGRIGDHLGRKRAFVAGLLGFALASALGGAAVDEWMLFLARALQGAFAAVLAPAALSLITTAFTEDKERATAFGIYGAVSGGGGALGALLGGVLTDLLSWRWCLYINIPIAVVAAAAAIPTVHASKVEQPGRYDFVGAILAIAGVSALVFAFAQAAEPGSDWTAPEVILPLLAGLALLVVFVIVEARTRQPLLPLRVLADRTRGPIFAALTLVGAGMFGMLLILTYYLQSTLGFSPLQTGLGFLPFAGGIVLASTVAGKIALRFGQRPVMIAGAVLATVGAGWLITINTHSTYLDTVLGATVVMSLGLGLVFTPTANTALAAVSDRDAGVASALLNITNQVGGAVGTALLNSLAATTAIASAAVIDGYRAAFTASTILFAAVALTLALARPNRGPDTHISP